MCKIFVQNIAENLEQTFIASKRWQVEITFSTNLINCFLTCQDPVFQEIIDFFVIFVGKTSQLANVKCRKFVPQVWHHPVKHFVLE